MKCGNRKNGKRQETLRDTDTGRETQRDEKDRKRNEEKREAGVLG